MRDPMHFDARAEVYERSRPLYPEALWARLRELGVLGGGRRVLDLGAGTGEATGRLVESGATVTAVEPGIALAERLRRRVPQARVVVATAEDVLLPDAAFDVAVVATAVHWFDLGIVVPKLHRVLRPGGQLAVWRTVFGDPEVSTPFRDRVSEIVAARPPADRPDALDPDHWTRVLTATGHFVVRHTEVFRWSVELDTDQIRGLFSTFSDWSAVEVEAAAQAADDLGGRVTEHYLTPLMLLDRVGPGTKA
ncbi:SAM-dependent methyltransferase [Nocardioides gansuensis]|uniref:SAM-dependent methyltransferase n=1 Tax=Nocardioides gansuensis TaxID=2138300 RepID=A0A2T8FDZ7_9ACTN|nr:class I SAM-dependent methyltransferase [Nocardioides gansuensis]PVG83938.1 SAM-dependent methyltransferase [Nocardioides gansuensis]